MKLLDIRSASLVLLVAVSISTGYLVGSNDGKNFKEQFIDLSFTCIQEQVKNNAYHTREARRIMQSEELSKEQASAYVKSTQLMCMERKVLR